MQTWVPSLHAFAIRTSYLTVAVSANENVSAFDVSMAGSDQSAVQSTNYAVVNGVVNITSLLQGGITLSIAGVDLAGNVALVPTVVSIVVMSTLPQTVVTRAPPLVTNAGNVTIGVASPNSRSGLLAHFTVLVSAADSDGAAVDLPSLVVDAIQDGVPVTSVAFDYVVTMSAVYTMSISAVDVLGGTGDAVIVTTTVDLFPPQSWFVSSLPTYTNESTVVLAAEGVDDFSSVWLQFRSSDGPWGSQQTYDNLAEGLHVFDVRGVDGAGNVQPAPYDTVSTTVDVHAPRLAITAADGSPLPLYTRNTTHRVCVLVTDSAPVEAALSVDGVVVPLDAVLCASVTTASSGMHVVVAGAVDAAGNAADPVSVSFVSDFDAPGHAVSRRDDFGCAVQDGVTCCQGVAASVFNVSCSEADGVDAVAPCHVQWALQSFLSSETCSADTGAPVGSAWTTVSTADAVVNVTAQVLIVMPSPARPPPTPPSRPPRVPCSIVVVCVCGVMLTGLCIHRRESSGPVRTVYAGV